MQAEEVNHSSGLEQAFLELLLYEAGFSRNTTSLLHR